MSKEAHLAGLDKIERRAYHSDVLRVFPRLLFSIYVGVAVWVANWFMGIKDPTMAQGTFVSTVWGVFPLMLNFYCQNGVDWAARIAQRVAMQQKEPAL